MRFRKLMVEKMSIDPFLSSVTIASACNKIYRKLFMKENTIGIIPYNGYNHNDKQSAIGLKWIKWIAETERIQIRHAKNGGEVHIGNYKVDGISGSTVFEFHGCYFHGCKKCFKKRNQTVAGSNLTADEAFSRTLQRKQYIESKGYTVIEKWGCELEQELANNKEMANFFEKCAISDPIEPREGFLIF